MPGAPGGRAGVNGGPGPEPTPGSPDIGGRDRPTDGTLPRATPTPGTGGLPVNSNPGDATGGSTGGPTNHANGQ
jgi:hypothetical protein